MPINSATINPPPITDLTTASLTTLHNITIPKSESSIKSDATVAPDPSTTPATIPATLTTNENSSGATSSTPAKTKTILTTN